MVQKYGSIKIVNFSIKKNPVSHHTNDSDEQEKLACPVIVTLKTVRIFHRSIFLCLDVIVQCLSTSKSDKKSNNYYHAKVSCNRFHTYCKHRRIFSRSYILRIHNALSTTCTLNIRAHEGSLGTVV